MTNAPLARAPMARTLHGQVLDQLGLDIVSGRLDVGSQLPPEEIFASELGISKGGFREVVKALASKGMLSVKPKTGTVVNPRQNWVLFDPQVLDWHTALPASPLIEQLLELRTIVEPQASRLACDRGTPADISAIHEAHRQMEVAFSAGESGFADFLSADLEFHQTILRASGNELVGQLGRLFAGALRHGFDITLRVQGSVERSLPLHGAIAEAITRRNPKEAEEASRRLLLTTSEELRSAGGEA